MHGIALDPEHNVNTVATLTERYPKAGLEMKDRPVTSGRMLLANPLSPDTLLSGSSALVILGLVLFAETGLLIGFFLPGDTLLFAAGVSIATGQITTSLTAFLIVAPIAAFLGNLVGYLIGYRAGPVIFDRPNSRFFRPEHVVRAQRFYDRFGSWTIIVGRFVAIVRTFATVMAGVARMRFSSYAIYSAIGAVLWADGVLLLGRQLGKIKFVQHNKGKIDYLVILVVVLSLVPVAVHWFGSRRSAPNRSSDSKDTGH
jgi:membrane-associated protein